MRVITASWVMAAMMWSEPRWHKGQGANTRHPSIFWIEFAEQWDPKSVWAARRVRLAVHYALDRQAINAAACLGYCPPAGVIVPRLMD